MHAVKPIARGNHPGAYSVVFLCEPYKINGKTTLLLNCYVLHI